MNAVAELQEARRVYPGRAVALDGIDLVIGEGEAVGLIGPNGAGKTTLVKLLLGLLKPTSGSVKLWDHEAYVLPVALKRRIGFLLETPGIYGNLSVEENLLFWAKLYDVHEQQVPETLKAWDLSDKRKKLARTLSAGLKQRLAIAVALLHDAPFAVLDEPTSNLDPESRKGVVDFLQKREKGQTLLISSHDLFDIERMCTRVVLLRQGGIVAQGTVEELRRQLGVGREVRIRVSQEIPEGIRQTIAERFVSATITGDEVVVSDRTTDAKDLVRYFVEQGVDVERVEESRVTLEDIYTQMVKEDEAG